MADRNQEGLNNIITAINNIVEPKISNSKFDRTFRAKVIEQTENEDYIVQINNINYTLKYAGKLEPNQIVRVKAPLNNFSDIYIEPLPGSGGGTGGTDNYNDLINKPILETDVSENLDPDKSELIKGTIKLHKISKTGDYTDLNNKPDLNFIPETEKASANGVATLDSDKKVVTEQLPIASTSELGVIKAGANVVIADDGTLSVIGGSGGTVSDTLPIGSVVVWYSDIIPTNWLLLNGQEVSRTEYAELFAIYGTKYGAGDGSTTFNLPDRRKKFGFGKSGEAPYDELGNTGGEETHKLIKAELPAERLKVIDSRYLPSREIQVGSFAIEGNAYPGIRVNENEGSGFLTTENMGSGTPMNNMPPYIVENYIVKAKQTVATVATVIDNLTSTSGTDALSANMGRQLNEDLTDLNTKVDNLSITGNYNELTNKPKLNTNNGTAQTVNSSEEISGTINLHKISKTGSYSDLLNKPSLDFIPTDQKGAANGVATLDNNKKVTTSELPSNLVYDSSYVHTDNNFTTALKNKLDGIESSAQVNKIEKIQRNGTELTITNKTVDITVPASTSDLTNDSGFITDTVNNLTNYYLKTQTYTQAEVNNLIGQIKTVSFEVVDELPTTGDSNKIYLVPKTGTTNDIYNEYIWINNAWELIGSTQVDLDNYYNKTQTDNLLGAKQDKITGAASSITSKNLTFNRALVSDGNGKVSASNVTSTEVGYLSGLRSNIQTQIDNITTSGGQANVIEVIQENGVPLEITNKTVNVIVPANIADGSADGSLRTINSERENNDYKIGRNAFAEGFNSKASGLCSHAEGSVTIASGDSAHAEGGTTSATGDYSHSEGYLTYATGDYSHAEGYLTEASSAYQHVEGKYNVKDNHSKYLHIVGNGISTTNRSNAHTLDKDGNAWYSGDVYVGSTSGTNKDDGSIKLVKETDLSSVATSGSYNDLTDKPTIPSYSVATESADGLMSSSDKTKLDGIAIGAEVNVQPDWDITDTSSDAYIKNKPTIPTVIDNHISTSTTNALSANQGRILSSKVSVSEAPPDTSNTAKLWVDTSPELTGGSPDLLYNNSDSGDWKSLLASIRESSLIDITSQCSFVNCTLIGGKIYVDKVKGIVYIQVQLDITATSEWGNLIYIPLDYAIEPIIPAQAGAGIAATQFWGYNTVNNVQIRGAYTSGTNISILGYYLMKR